MEMGVRVRFALLEDSSGYGDEGTFQKCLLSRRLDVMVA